MKDPRIIYSEINLNLDIIENIKSIPGHLQSIFSNAIAFLVAACFGIGVVLAIVGAIQWATGWDDKGGKKTVVKGIVLIGISLVSGGGILAGYMYL